MSCFALLDCNNFYAACERLFNPRLEGKPVIVLSKTLVKRANHQAKQAPQGIFSLCIPEVTENVLEAFPIEDVWGIADDLFQERPIQKRSQLTEALDSINDYFDKDAVFFAPMGTKQEWRMRSNKRSPLYTTSWSDLALARVEG